MDYTTPLAPACSASPRRAARPIRRVAVAVVLALVASLVGAGARADEDPPGRVGRVAQVSGDVRTVDADGAWVPLPRNQPLSTGDRVITDKDGRAVVQIGSSTVRVGAYSDMTVARLDDDKIRLRFDHGQMAVRVRSTDILGELAIETEEGVWVPHHPGHFLFDRVPGQVLAAQAWSGDMLLEAPDSSLPLAGGQRAEVWREGSLQSTHYRMVAIPTDRFSDWAIVEDRLDDRYAAASGGASPLPAEMTGANDLGRYGRWSSSADYGTIWTPSNLAAGWQPYQDGNWSWVAPWGWTWVDNSPWGFAPFHYGRWVWLGGHWCWAPGNWGPRPVYAPALVGWLGGPNFSYGGSPAIGWVPLGPNEPFYPAYPVSPIYWNLVNGAHNVPPIRRTPGPVHGRPRIVPTGPIAYANRGVPGAVAIVAAGSLTSPQPVASIPAMQRPDHRRILGEINAGRVTALPPPAPPAGRSALARSAPVVQVPAAGVAPAAAVAPVGPPRPGVHPVRPGLTAGPEPIASQAIGDRRPVVGVPVPAAPAVVPPPAATPVVPAILAPAPVGATPPGFVNGPVAPAPAIGNGIGNGMPPRPGNAGGSRPPSDPRDRR